ncbi:MAG: o-succinylbenzoate synthase [Candidatus Kapabacteria bacterium]|jgi:O-succinylbenzoate synthase|nr:o-succinylbenzoate synthase [Candidatus Kapabacteria bacterium]
MQIKRLQIYKYKIPLNSPLDMKGEVLNNRDGLIVELTADNGLVGLGDCAPFPNLHDETIDVCIEDIRIKKTLIIHRSVSDSVDEVLSLYDDLKCPPSVRFALDCALINIAAANSDTGFSEFINPARRSNIEVNGLLTGNDDDILNEAERLIKAGFSVLKLKVGRRSIADDISAVRKLQLIIGNNVKLRADANRAWSFDQAVEFAEGVSDRNLEYIEEPIDEPERISELFVKTGLPMAFDESLYGKSIEEIKIFEGLGVFVLKPSVLGSIKNTLRFIEFADRNNIKPVISSAFESGIGLYALAGLASCTKLPAAAGLDTYKWFEHDIASKPFSAEFGRIDIHEADKSMNSLNYELLEEIIL